MWPNPKTRFPDRERGGREKKGWKELFLPVPEKKRRKGGDAPSSLSSLLFPFLFHLFFLSFARELTHISVLPAAVATVLNSPIHGNKQ